MPKQSWNRRCCHSSTATNSDQHLYAPRAWPQSSIPSSPHKSCAAQRSTAAGLPLQGPSPTARNETTSSPCGPYTCSPGGWHPSLATKSTPATQTYAPEYHDCANEARVGIDCRSSCGQVLMSQSQTLQLQPSTHVSHQASTYWRHHLPGCLGTFAGTLQSRGRTR